MTDENTRPQPAPPEGEPDFEKLVDDLEHNWVKAYLAGDPLQRDKSLVRGAYRLGLAARPKVKDAEVRAHCERLRARGNPVLHQAADLLERLAGERAELVDDARAANDLAKDVIPMVERAETAESKLAEREAELAQMQREREHHAELRRPAPRRAPNDRAGAAPRGRRPQ